MTIGSTVSLFAVDLERVLAVWRQTSLAEHLQARPRGRVATVLGLASLAAANRDLPAARTALGVPAADARDLFEALVDDLAVARLHDAPFTALAQALASLARTSKLRALDMSALQAAPPAYPAEVRAPDGSGLVVWLKADAVPQTRPDAGPTPRTGDATLWRDLVDAIGELLDARLGVLARIV